MAEEFDLKAVRSRLSRWMDEYIRGDLLAACDEIDALRARVTALEAERDSLRGALRNMRRIIGGNCMDATRAQEEAEITAADALLVTQDGTGPKDVLE